MAIATRPKQRKNSIQHKKRHGHHQKRNSHFVKTYWPYLPLLFIVGLGMFVNSLMLHKTDVLSYATDMTQSGLLSSTNARRAEHGLGALALNATLSQAAQAKAADMAARDYWSHNTPDGKEPWVFISQAGYNYIAAGENLAYGFATSNDAVIGWMNSPGHRANILNTRYTEVGFGIVNSASYQGNGEQTIVVALYAQPANNVAAAPSAPSSTPSTSTQGNTPSQAAGADTEAAQPIAAERSETSNEITVSAVVPEQKQVTRVEMATSGAAPWSIFAVSVVIVLLLMVFVTRHSLAWHRRFAKGEKFILKHKVLDVVIVSAIMIGFILTRTVGVIQ